MMFAALSVVAEDGPGTPAPAVASRRVATHSAAPLRFEPNRGQSRKDVRYVGRAGGYKVALEPRQITFAVPARASRGAKQTHEVALPMSLSGSQANPEVSAFGPLVGRSSYFPNSDPHSWITNIPTFSGVRYRGVYPHTDLVFHGDANQFEYDFQLAPGGDPSRIAWRLPATAAVQVRQGDLVLQQDGVELRFRKPVAFQQSSRGRQNVRVSYRIQRDAQGTLVRFAVGSYDHRRTLVIDPVLSSAVLVYSTQVTALPDISASTADAAGNVYLADSVGALEVVKLATDGKTLLYNATIGTAYAAAASLAVDGSGQLYITGQAVAGYVTTANAYQPASGSGYHAFLTVLNPSGSGLVYSSFLQGSNQEYGTGVALDPTGKILVSGWTTSLDFPNTNNVTLNGSQTPFVVKLDPALSGNASLLYSALFPATYNYYYYGSAVAVGSDSAGNAYTALYSSPLTTTPGAFNYAGIYNTSGGVYVAKIGPTGVTQFISYLGYGEPHDLAVDGAGNTYVTGVVQNGDFPATAGAYDENYPSAFVTKLNASGTALVYSTFLGTPTGQFNFSTPIIPTSIAIPAGCTTNCTPYVSGYTYVNDLPTTNAIQNTFGGTTDAFIVNLSADGAAAPFVTYLGGSYDESSYTSNDLHIPQISLDGSGNMYLAGNTSYYYNLNDFPFTSPGSRSGPFVAKISPTAGATVIPGPNSLDFSYQTMTVASAPQTVVLRNLGTLPATISAITSSNAAFSETDNCAGSIPAGGSCTMQVRFTPASPGTIAGTISIAHSGTNSPATVSLQGIGQDQALLTISPSSNYDFGGQAVNTTSAPLSLTVTNIGTQPAQINSITAPYSPTVFVLTTNCPEFLPVGASCAVQVTFQPYAVGLITSSVSISAYAQVLPTSSISLRGMGIGLGAASLTPSTTAVTFLDQIVGTVSSSQYVQIQNTGTVPVSMGPDSIAGDFKLPTDYCSGANLLPGNTCYFYVSFAPTQAAAATGTMTIKNTAGPDLVISLSGNGITSNSQLIFSPAATVFADQVVGTQSQDTQITVTNNGNSTVSFSRVYDGGSADFRLTYNGCSVVGPLQQCYVNVAFTPTTTGPLSGSITFQDSAAGSPHTVTVAGNGLSPTSSVIATPSSAAFDDTVVGVTSPAQAFVLYNPGNTDVTATTPVSSAPDFQVTSNGCSTIPAQSYCYIYVVFQPKAAGAITATLTIPNSAPGGSTVINLAGNGLIATDSLIPSPLSAGFPDTVVGTTSSYQLIYFFNPGNTAVTVSNVAVGGDYVIYSNGCSTVGPNSYCYVYLQFTPTAAGIRTGTLSVFDNTSGSPHTVSLSGNGVNPLSTLVPTPSNVGFDDQVVGTTSGTAYVYLYNSGNLPITISNITVSGDFASTGGCTTIPAQSYCYLPVTFTPTAAGQRTGTVTLVDSAAGSPHGISLYGNGIAATATVAVTPAAIDFGSVATNTSASDITVFVNNTGSQNVVISAVTITAPFTGSGCLTTVSPGSYCAIAVTVNPGATTGVITGTLTFTDSATGSPHVVNLTANGVAATPAIYMQSNAMAFLRTVVGVASSTQSVYFNNHSGATITISGVSTTGDFAVSSNGCATVGNNGNCGVGVKFTPTASGNRTGTLVFTHNGPGGSTTINLAGYGDPSTSSAQLSASALGFPTQVVGTSSGSQTVYLWNNSTVPLTGVASSITGDFTITYNGCNGTISPGSYCQENVNFQPSAAGSATGALTIVASDPGSPHIVQLSGAGATATRTLALTASTIQFPDQTVGYASNNQSVAVYNTGNSPVTFTAPGISGDYAITYNGCSTVQPGSSCYLNLTFTPTVTGARPGALTLNSNATGSPHTVSLAGNGVAATKQFALTASAFAYPDQPLNVQSGTQYAQLYNTGTAPLVLSGSSATGDYSISYNGCYAQTLQPNSACTVGVIFTPTATGTRTGAVSIGTDAAAGAAIISLTGNAVNQSSTARLSATSLTFADQATGSTSQPQLLYLYNTGNVPLPVSSVLVTGDYSSTYNGCSGTVSVGSYCYIYIVFTPTTTGPRTGTVQITDSSTSSPHTVSLAGNGATPSLKVNVNPASLVFAPTITATASNYASIVVTNVGNAAVQMGSSSITGSDFLVYYSSCEGVQLSGPGYNCVIDVQFRPTTTGALTGTLHIANNAAGNPQAVALSGTGVDPNNAVQLSQNAITFANQPTNTSSPASTVYLLNQGSTPVSVSSVVVSGDFLVSGCAGATVYQGTACSMSITFKPTATGTRTGSVTITDNATGSPRTVSLTGTGVTPFPIVTLIPNNLVFGNTNVGSSSSTQYIQVYNTGSAPLNVSSITGSTAEFTLSNGCTAAVAVGSYCTVGVTFVPTGSAGSRSVTLQLNDDAPNTPQSIPLAANATAAGPIATLSTTTVGFPSQAVSTTSAAQALNVTNNGATGLVFGTESVTGPFAIAANGCIGTLAPTGSCTIQVTFTPTASGLSSGTLSIPDNAPGSPHVVGLSGTGVAGPQLSISPTNLVFNSQQLGKTSTAQAITITNSGSTVTFTAAPSINVGAPFSVSSTSCGATLGAGGSCTISVTFTPTSVGTQAGTLSIPDNAPGSPQTVALSGNGVGQPAVSLSSTSLTFANQNVGTTSPTQSVTLTNSGTGPLAINSIGTTGDYSVTHNCGNNLSVNASCTLTVSFTPNGANTRTGSVNIADDAPGSPQSIALTGVGVGAVATLSSTSLTFTTQTVGTTSAAQTFTLTNTGNADLTVSSISSSSTEFAQTNNCPATVVANASCTISVTFGPIAAGTRGGYIYLYTSVNTQSVSLSGTGTGPVGSVSPSQLSFGSVGIGTPSAAQTVTVSSTGTTALAISGISVSGDYSQTNNCPPSLAIGSNCAIQVTFTPAAPGVRNGSLFINDNGSFGGHTVTLLGSGLGALLSLNPSSLTFGTVAVNTTTSAQSITVTNTGTVSITGLTVSAATGDFTATNNCPSSLAVSATCSINVTFKPTAAGTRTGSLTVTSNAATQTATFSGAGSGPVAQLSPPSLSFGSVVQNTTSAAQTVTLTNTGNAVLNLSSITSNGDFAATNNCPAALTVNSLCTISVTFTPTTLGGQTGAVTIVDDATNSPQSVGLSGTGIVPQEDLVLTGAASPASIAPGGSTTYTFVITNNGPSAATSVNFTASAPTNAVVTSATASVGSCTTGASITCSLGNLAVKATATVTIAATSTANGVLSTTASVSALEPDPNTANNSVTATATVAVADLVVTSSGQSGATLPTYVVIVADSGPASASNVSLTCVPNRFTFGTVNSSQGSCTQSGGNVVCSLGSMAASASANITLQLRPPSTGWASIACHATATEYDPNPLNSVAEMTSDGATNTEAGDNVGVQLYDNRSGVAARIVFPSVKQAGTTTLTSLAGATPPAGFRSGSVAWTYDVATTATINGSPLVTFAVTAGQFHHPANVRLFHMENGAWVDRTVASNPATSTIAGIAATLSPFALFEPVNHAPLANAGSDRVAAATSVLGATVSLDAGNSSDADGDALSYRWTGPFAEGNGVASGVRPNVTLPFGTSRLTLVANDGEADSAPVTVNVTVTDFGIAVGNATPSMVRGSSTSVPVTINAIGGAFDSSVTLGCANVPAGMSCAFSPATVQPGTNGATSTLTLSSSPSAMNHRQPSPWTFGTLMFGAAGVVLMGGKRRRHALLLTLALLAIILLVQVGCGGGNSSISSNLPAANPSTTVTITVTGSSAGLQHSSTINVTLR